MARRQPGWPHTARPRHPLRSWKLQVRAAWVAHYGDYRNYYPIDTWYIVARTKKSACFQAKRMSGYTKVTAHTMKAIHHCEVLEVLE